MTYAQREDLRIFHIKGPCKTGHTIRTPRDSFIKVVCEHGLDYINYIIGS